MTDEYGAYSPQLKKAARTVAQTLKELTEKQIKKATLYHYGPQDNMLIEGRGGEPKFDYADPEKLKAQLEHFERVKKAPFVAKFDDTGKENDHTDIAVHALGADPHLVQPDKTHLRLRGILHQKRDQLPKASRGIIVLDLSDLEKYGVDERTVMSALYGDMQVTWGVTTDGEEVESSLSHRPNGFFTQTSRASAVVVERCNVAEEVEITREVFPTCNSKAVLLTRAELECFGTLVPDLDHLCHPE
jgi:DNA-binding HxlR family transcriptional regulator